MCANIPVNMSTSYHKPLLNIVSYTLATEKTEFLVIRELICQKFSLVTASLVKVMVNHSTRD